MSRNLKNFDLIQLAAGLELLRGYDLTEIIVSVIDTGVDFTHKGLKTNMWRDENGHHGFDYIERTHNVIDASKDSHGTHIAGTIATIIGDERLSKQGKIMVRKPFKDNYDAVFDAQCAQAIRDSYDAGARVINISWCRKGGQKSDALIDEAIDYVTQKGVVVVCAAGNFRSDAALFFPSNNKNVISVASSTQLDYKTDDSNFGDETIYAPGLGIYSFLKNNQFGYLNGTSMAAPHVAGLAALALAVNPQLSPKQVKNLIFKNADEVIKDPENQEVIGSRINVFKVISQLVISQLVIGQ